MWDCHDVPRGLKPLHGCRIIAGLKACSTLAAALKLLRPKHTSATKGPTPSKSTPIQIAFPVLKLERITKSGKNSCRKSNKNVRRNHQLFGGDALAEAAQNNHAADAKTGNRPQSERFGHLRTEMNQVAQKSNQSEEDSQDVQPRR